MTNPLVIHSSGPLITSTNFWESQLERDGLLYLSINAKAFRLLLPRKWEPELPELATAKLEIAKKFQGGFYSKADRNAKLSECYTSPVYARKYQMYELHQPGVIVRPELPELDARRELRIYFFVNRLNGAVSCKSYDVYGAHV